MIVVFELRAGARSVVEFRQLQRLVDASRRRDRLLVPTEQEWLTAAQIVRHYAGRLGALNPWTHVGDVLILLGAARVGGEVVTQNLQDFNRWALELRAAGQDVGVSDRL